MKIAEVRVSNAIAVKAITKASKTIRRQCPTGQRLHKLWYYNKNLCFKHTLRLDSAKKEGRTPMHSSSYAPMLMLFFRFRVEKDIFRINLSLVRRNSTGWRGQYLGAELITVELWVKCPGLPRLFSVLHLLININSN